VKHYWNELAWYKYGDDRHGILAYFDHEPTPADLARCFEGTSAAVWGNILRGRGATGTYGEIIAGIKKYGIKVFIGDGYWKDGAKNKSERHLMTGRRAKKKAEIEKRKRLHEEPCF